MAEGTGQRKQAVGQMGGMNGQEGARPGSSRVARFGWDSGKVTT